MRQTLELPPGLYGDDTSLGARGRWRTGSLVRFRLGRPEVDGGWEALVNDTLGGVCRTVFPWSDNNAITNIAFGTHKTLEVWQGGGLFDITPYGPPVRLPDDPLSTTNGSATVTVTHAAHGYTTGDSVKIHGSEATGGIAATNLDGTRTITVVDDDSYTFPAGASASSTVTGGGSQVVVTLQATLAAGAIDGTDTAGYGTGGYGVGPYGQTSPTEAFYPRTWSFGAWGENLLASPRGGGLYLWENDTDTAASAIDGAPTQVTYALVAPMDGGYMAFALGCDQWDGSGFSPTCIRHSAVRDITDWDITDTASTSRQYFLNGGGEIVAGRMCGPYMLVWTTVGLYLGTFVGALEQPWRFDEVGRGCGLIGPNAAVVTGQTAYWVTPDGQLYTYALGGQPQPLPCPILSEFADNLAAAQGDKIVASYINRFSEVRFDYPDKRDGYENSRFIRVCTAPPDTGSWSTGVQARTAFVGEGPTQYPIGVTYGGQPYYHERGNSADGDTLAWFIETADQYLDIDRRMLVKGLWPDFKDQMGGVTVTLTSRETPQGDETVTTSDPVAPGDSKADLLASGRLFRVKFSGQSAPARCRIGAPAFETEPLGRY